MKGLIFTEFIAMAESQFGMNTVDAMFDRAAVPSGGGYAATGTYPHTELVSLVSALSGLAGVAVPELVRGYGRHLFSRLAASFPQYLSRSSSAFEFICSVDSYIHVEVRKIYPEAELPRFVSRLSPDGRSLELEYHSPRRFDELAHGLLEGTLAHFGTGATIERRPLPANEPGSLFVLTDQGGS